MPASTVYRHGATVSIPPTMGNPNPAKRGQVTGWSQSAARRNVAFLRSIDETRLTGEGWAITLTVKECPATPADWTAAARAWMTRQFRAGAIRLHWVMEFQRRGVPHLHAAIWYADDVTPRRRRRPKGGGDAAARLPRPLSITQDWVEVAEAFGPRSAAQHARPIDGVVGWFMYLAKHCSRSARHYQRQRESVPAAWGKSPRVWGHRGDWPQVDPSHVDLTRPEFYRLRRLVKRRRLAEARAALPLNGRQVNHLRRLLKCPDRKRSEVRAVSEWIPEAQMMQLIDLVKRR